MKVFITAGEPSGDRLAAALIAGLRTLVPDVEFKGIAGPEMQQNGMTSLFDMSELSLMGIAEILPKYRHLKRRIQQTAQAALDWKPDVVITLDSPDFSHRVAKLIKLQDSSLRTVHYVAPTVWAWRPGRAKKMSHFIDHVLALFPFEPPYMQEYGIDCDFVGHPISTIEPASQAEITAFWERSKLDQQRKTLVVLPGSRRSEIDRLMPVFCEVLKAPFLQEYQFVFPTLPHLKSQVEHFCTALSHPCFIQSGQGRSAMDAARDRHVAYSASDFGLAASGTVSLELAAAKTPMVIAYDMAFLSRIIISAMLRTDTVTLVNLVSETRVVPEFIGKECTPENIQKGLASLIACPDHQTAVLATTMQRLGQGGEAPGLRAAKAVLARL